MLYRFLPSIWWVICQLAQKYWAQGQADLEVDFSVAVTYTKLVHPRISFF